MTYYEEPQPYVYQAWPAWRYGPDGEAAIFDGPDDVPEGWGTTPTPLPVAFQVDPPQEISDEEETDEGSPEAGDPAEAGQEEGQTLTPRKRGRPRKDESYQF